MLRRNLAGSLVLQVVDDGAAMKRSPTAPRAPMQNARRKLPVLHPSAHRRPRSCGAAFGAPLKHRRSCNGASCRGLDEVFGVAMECSPVASELWRSPWCSIETLVELQWSFVGGSRAPIQCLPALPVLHLDTRRRLVIGAAMERSPPAAPMLQYSARQRSCCCISTLIVCW
ncbi:hypothetical protein D1007_48064 [Hordeum vulgare]|nr:hypothetical protein D1007_48064 [Hordeum vulgare]